MQPIPFKEANTIYGKNQPEYLPLYAHKTEDGIVTSCWRLSFFECIKVLFTGRIWLRVMTFNQKLQPQRLSTSIPREVRTAVPEEDS